MHEFIDFFTVQFDNDFAHLLIVLVKVLFTQIYRLIHFMVKYITNKFTSAFHGYFQNDTGKFDHTIYYIKDY